MRKYNLDYYYDNELKARPRMRDDMTDFVRIEMEAVAAVDVHSLNEQEAKPYITKIGHLANYLKILRRSDEAHQYYKTIDELINRFNFDKKMKLVNKIRWADNYRCNRQLVIAETWFKDCYRQAQATEDLWNYEDFCLQHLGKVYFDQQKYAAALDAFARTLKLRLEKSDRELIESTKLALATTRSKINKISVIGNSCSGKTTLCIQLRDLFQLPVCHVDGVQYLSGLQWRNPDETRTILQEMSERPQWIIDGLGPLKILEDRLKKSELIVMLRPPLSALYFRLLKRQIRSLYKKREELPENCFEATPGHTYRMIKTIWNVHHGLWKQLDQILERDQYRNKVILLRSSSEVSNWVRSISY